jgi:hypothetical protein
VTVNATNWSKADRGLNPERLIAASIQWAEQIMRKIDAVCEDRMKVIPSEGCPLTSGNLFTFSTTNRHLPATNHR